MPLRDDISERARALVGRVLKGKWRLERGQVDPLSVNASADLEL